MLRHDVLHKAAIISVALRVLSAAVVRGAAAAGEAADSAGSKMVAAFQAPCKAGQTDARRSRNSGITRHWGALGYN